PATERSQSTSPLDGDVRERQQMSAPEWRPEELAQLHDLFLELQRTSSAHKRRHIIGQMLETDACKVRLRAAAGRIEARPGGDADDVLQQARLSLLLRLLAVNRKFENRDK